MDNLNIVLDISSIIWDKENYEKNRHHYYHLAEGITYLLDKLDSENVAILLRAQLLQEMTGGFPFDILPQEFYYFGNVVYSFLGKIGSRLITYPSQTICNLVSIPNLINEYYNNNVKEETQFLLTYMHQDDESLIVYCTFEYLWNCEHIKLQTKVAEDVCNYDTLISDNSQVVDQFFENFKPVFEHNPKHDKATYKTKLAWEKRDNKSGFISQLSCYDGSNNDRPQKLLDKALKTKDIYVGYDNDNGVWVIFRCHIDNKYHGYDEYDINEIPDEVRKHFNK